MSTSPKTGLATHQFDSKNADQKEDYGIDLKIFRLAEAYQRASFPYSVHNDSMIFRYMNIRYTIIRDT